MAHRVGGGLESLKYGALSITWIMRRTAHVYAAIDAIFRTQSQTRVGHKTAGINGESEHRGEMGSVILWLSSV